MLLHAVKFIPFSIDIFKKKIKVKYTKYTILPIKERNKMVYLNAVDFKNEKVCSQMESNQAQKTSCVTKPVFKPTAEHTLFGVIKTTMIEISFRNFCRLLQNSIPGPGCP